jgi:hypothetical protein
MGVSVDVDCRGDWDYVGCPFDDCSAVNRWDDWLYDYSSVDYWLSWLDDYSLVDYWGSWLDYCSLLDDVTMNRG